MKIYSLTGFPSALTGSFTGSFFGDGSGLTGTDSGSWDGDFVGSAKITGSLSLSGSFKDQESSPGTAGQVLSSTVSGSQWVDVEDPDAVTGSGNVGTIPKWATTTSLGNSIITEAASAITVGGAATFSNIVRIYNYTLSSDFGTGYNISLGVSANGATDKGINFGWNTTSDFGFIGAVHNATGWKSLVLQPVNGTVGIRTSTPSTSYVLDVGGATRIQGAVTSKDLNVIDTYANDPLIKLATNTSGNAEVQIRTATTTYNPGIGIVTSGFDFNLFTNNTTRLTISSTGDATFNGNILSNGGEIFSKINGGATAAVVKIGSGATWQLRSNPITGTNSYGLDIISGVATPLVRLSISSGGDVLINATSRANVYDTNFKTLSIASTVSDKASIIELIGTRGAGGNQNGMIHFLNNSAAMTETSQISGLTAAGTNGHLGGVIGFNTKEHNGSLRRVAQFTDSGNLLFALSGKGIVFNQSAGSGTSTSETLDAYEEGTWTGTQVNDGVGLSNTGSYTRIGNTVFFKIYIAGNITSAGLASITGLPYGANNNNGYNIFSYVHGGSLANSRGGYISGTTLIPLTNGGTGGVDWVTGNVSSMFSGTYTI